MEPPIHIESTSGWLPSRGGCDLLYPPKFATASWPIVPSTAAELPRCTATESLCLYSELAMTNIIPFMLPEQNTFASSSCNTPTVSLLTLRCLLIASIKFSYISEKGPKR